MIQYRKKEINLNFTDHEVLYPLLKSSLQLEAENLPALTVGIYLMIEFDVYENRQKIGQEQVFLYAMTGKQYQFDLTFPRHGHFNLKNFHFMIRDIFGLTEFKQKANCSHLLSIHPYFLDEVKIPFYLEKGGDEILQTHSREESTDFFENRKYYPGDDPRRINWKIFAHSEELHVREVEKIPPKMGRLSVIFTPYSTDYFEYEYICALFYTTILYLLKFNLKINILSPGSSRELSIEKNDQNKINTILNQSYQKKAAVIDQQQLKNYHCPVFFTSFEELAPLKDKQLIDQNSFCVVSFAYQELLLKNLLRSFIRIEQSDNLFFELYQKKKLKQHYQAKLEQIKAIKKDFLAQKIDMKVYQVNEDEFIQK